jgi:hypothetical protein
VNTGIKVVRYQLLRRADYLVLPWAWLCFGFAVDLVVFSLLPVHDHWVATAHGLVRAPDTSGRDAWGLVAIVSVFLGQGVVAAARALPFALALGVSRRTYYAATGLLAATLSAAYGLVLTGLQAVERGTDGWGESAHIFRVPYLLDGPWYLTWLTSTVVLTLLFSYGMWIGVVHRRWNLAGTLTFLAAQITVLVAAAVLVTWSRAWDGVGRFFTALTAAGLTGLLAAAAVLVLAGGYTTIRRATV